ncbi:MAG: dihydrolipoamide acetyltransferase family protein [Litorimonas sp.]
MGTYRFKLPDIGEGVVEAEITAWYVNVGDTVEEDQPLADAMTDKATIELTAPVAGVIKTVACEEGDILAVGADLVVFTTDGPGNDDGGSEPELAAPAPVSALPEVEAKNASVDAPTATTKPIPSAAITRSVSGGRTIAAPAVRLRATQLNIDLSVVPSQDENGRVTHNDLDAYLLSGKVSGQGTTSVPTQAKSAANTSTSSSKAAELPLEDGETRQKVIGLRRVIATRMSEAKRYIPHFTYVEEIDVTELEAFRTRANSLKTDDKPKLTVLPLIIRALAITLEDWPQFNARYHDGSDGLEGGFIRQFTDLNLGIATQTDTGLIVPVLKKAQTLSVWEMAVEIARLAEGARKNKLGTDELTGASTTLTSLGPLGGIVTTPVINRPEVAIFGPNKIRKILALENAEIIERKVMNFSVSCDHRVIDGYDAAKMMQDLKARLQDPKSIFLL